MAGAQSKLRQDDAHEYLAQVIPYFYVPTKKERKKILSLLGIPQGFVQAFDAIRLKVKFFSEIVSAKDFDLLEIKTSDMYLPNFPKGYYFSVTENEAGLAKVLELEDGKYTFCFVCLHEKSQKYCLMSWADVLKQSQGTPKLVYHVHF